MAVSNDVLEGPKSGTRSAASPAALVSVGVLSFRALQTISRTLKAHRESGLIDCVGEFFVHFNAITPDDKEIAEEAGVRYTGTAQNLGIYGGFRAIAEQAQNPYVLILENDVVPLPGAAVRQCLETCVSDMIEHCIRSFSMQNISRPSVCLSRSPPLLPRRKPRPSPNSECSWSMAASTNSGRRRCFVSGILRQCKNRPFASFPAATTCTDSRYRNWSNQAVLVERQYLFDVVCHRVDEHPDPRLVNGHQDMERALNQRWWRCRRDRMGHAAEGIFTHRRLDR